MCGQGGGEVGVSGWVGGGGLPSIGFNLGAVEVEIMLWVCWFGSAQ